MRSPAPVSPEFERLVAGSGDVSIERVALEIAADHYAGLDVQAYLDRIDVLADRVRARRRPSACARDVLAQINWVLYVEEDFQGNVDEYDDPRNSFMNEVLDRRLGIPISLGVVYRAVGRRVGLDIEGVNLPFHFMLRVEEQGTPWFIDAFHAGAVMNAHRCQERISILAQKPIVLTAEMLEPCAPGELVSRMLRNLKALYTWDDDLDSHLPCQRRLAALNPDDWRELRDLGVLCLRLRRYREAEKAFERAIPVTPSRDRARLMTRALESLRREMARWN